MSVGVMEDYKLRDLRASHTLGGSKTPSSDQRWIVYYESIKRELKIKSIYECRCDGRLQTKTRKLRASDTRSCLL
jgi:hypothetical protein